ncbi:hypothetical protein BD626DRAFT_575550 [Schizophyllum amplum]|uniref:F-box domain-containing protein n=1 Tax=Schizophyllum amplum TaxID=97359 RepID=A0A550BVF5_9AGAR|nr:hypothetical protein BD626DRAFT_575550 [Auriculariopsis ampla]
MKIAHHQIAKDISAGRTGAMYAVSAEVWALITAILCLADTFSLGLTCKRLACFTRGERLKEICVSDKVWDSMVAWEDLEDIQRDKRIQTRNPDSPVFPGVAMPALRTIKVAWSHVKLLQGSLESTLPHSVSVYVEGYDQDEATESEYDEADVVLGDTRWKEVFIREDVIWRDASARASRDIRRHHLTSKLPTASLQFI